MEYRTITIGYPSGKPKMIMWQGTEDEESFAIQKANTNRPYVRAYGKTYYLNKKEKEHLKEIMELFDSITLYK